MKLSVIIPVFRVEKTLDRCVRSVMEQDYDDMEVILVDDGSPDKSPQMCDQWAAKDQRIRVIHKPNGGLSDARNAGLNVAKGDFVTFVDSDDYIAPHTYRPLMDMIAACPETDLLEFPVYRHYGTKKQDILSFREESFSDPKVYWLSCSAYSHSYACNKIFRASLFADNRFPVGVVFEDMAVLPKLLKEVRQIRTCNKGLYYYCDNDQGITATATGTELSMLLKHHLKAIPLACDTNYYMHIVNIQTDVTLMTNEPPTLPYFPVNPLGKGLSWKNRLKALYLRLFGLESTISLKRKIAHAK